MGQWASDAKNAIRKRRQSRLRRSSSARESWRSAREIQRDPTDFRLKLNLSDRFTKRCRVGESRRNRGLQGPTIREPMADLAIIARVVMRGMTRAGTRASMTERFASYGMRMSMRVAGVRVSLLTMLVERAVGRTASRGTAGIMAPNSGTVTVVMMETDETKLTQ